MLMDKHFYFICKDKELSNQFVVHFLSEISTLIITEVNLSRFLVTFRLRNTDVNRIMNSTNPSIVICLPSYNGTHLYKAVLSLDTKQL